MPNSETGTIHAIRHSSFGRRLLAGPNHRSNKSTRKCSSRLRQRPAWAAVMPKHIMELLSC
jgi:hypothetical protein